MKLAFLAVAFLAILASNAIAQTRVSGYMRQNGTYVQPYYRTYSDWTPMNNWSYYGNVNPMTGSMGTHRLPPQLFIPPAPLVPQYQPPLYAPPTFSPPAHGYRYRTW